MYNLFRVWYYVLILFRIIWIFSILEIKGGDGWEGIKNRGMEILYIFKGINGD